MFPWSAVFTTEPKVPGQRSPEELVTNTLMLELGAQVKRAERIRHERALEVRRRSSGSSVDYTWLAGSCPKQAYQLTPGEVLELQDLCAKVPPSRCGPVILKFRKLVLELEPDVYEVTRLFRSVLSDCLDEEEERELSEAESTTRAAQWQKQRSRSLSFFTFRSKLRLNPNKGGTLTGSRNQLAEEGPWGEEGDAEGSPKVARRGRSMSMPEIIPVEERVHS